MSRHKFVYMVVVDAKIRNAFFSCSATYLTKFFTDLFNFSRVPDKLRPNKNDSSPTCLDPSSVDQDVPKVNSHHSIFYGAPKVPKVHFFASFLPYRGCAVTMCCRWKHIAICALRNVRKNEARFYHSHAFSHRTHFVQKKVKRMCGFTTIVSRYVTSQEVHIHGSHQPWHGWRWRWVHLEALGHINCWKIKKNKQKQHVICIYFWRWNIRQFPHGSNIATVICELELLPPRCCGCPAAEGRSWVRKGDRRTVKQD